LGRDALLRTALLPPDKQLLGLVGDPTDNPAAPAEGEVLWHGDRQVGYVTSSRFSSQLGHAVMLGWVRSRHGATPDALIAGGQTVRPAATPFYDPEGARARL
jgi:glycine cleavage system aminomethyltransferase T